MESDVTRILDDTSLDPDTRARRLLPLVYDQLRATAQQALAHERQGHTLNATALVHEAYLKLVGNRQMPWEDRSHFFFAAAEAMRQILIDHARTRGREKRGGKARRIDLEFANVADLAEKNPETVMAVDEALCRLEDHDGRAARIARLRLYVGLPSDRVALMLGIGLRTVERDWMYARRWIARALLEEQQRDGRAEGQTAT